MEVTVIDPVKICEMIFNSSVRSKDLRTSRPAGTHTLMEQLNLTDVMVGNNSNCSTIDDFRNRVYTTTYSIITVVGLVGNGLALVVLIKTRSQNSPFHIYMMNLAMSDLLFVLTLPMRVLYYVKKGQWDLGDFLCRISSYTLYVNLYCSIYIMAAMSVTRFMAIVFPVQNMRLVTVKRARLVCVSIWLFISVSSTPFLMSGEKFDPVTNKTKCFEPPSSTQQLQKLKKMNYFALVVGFVVPFLVILICYVGIVRVLVSRNNVARRQSETGSKAIRMIVIVLLTFLICFMPYHIQRTIHLYLITPYDTCSYQRGMQKSVVVTLSLAAANTCFDPLLYFFSGESFRKRVSSFRISGKGKLQQREESQTM